MLDATETWGLLEDADLVCDKDTVDAAVRRVAAEITREVRDKVPLVLSVMGGGVVFTGQLLPMLRFPLEFDYVHVTRYRGATTGGDIEWIVKPRSSVAGRTVLVIDDILDEGATLAEIRKWLLTNGAEVVYTAVFADKDLPKEKPITADFVGVSVPDRYVFGFGMDVRDAWRNLPAVYALKE
ncbi:MAG TPA: hypoxanthine-guanine phosphoribosyltransferase [Burkholderiales bacterium]|nr:hypoxanthine-guanine phosphoribosyltransferase [Burkholderiales bacterium]